MKYGTIKKDALLRGKLCGKIIVPWIFPFEKYTSLGKTYIHIPEIWKFSRMCYLIDIVEIYRVSSISLYNFHRFQKFDAVPDPTNE